MTNIEQWVNESTRRFQEVLKERLADEQPSRFRYGYWTVAYTFAKPVREPSLRELVDLLARWQGKETGWPPFWVPTRAEIRPYPHEGTVECWLGEATSAPDDSDFWRASPRAEFFLLRGFQDDSGESEREPGTTLDVILPLWRAGECLLHASRVASDLTGDHDPIELVFAWEGLKGRRLENWASRGRHFWSLPTRPASQGRVETRLATSAAEIRENLASVAARATRPLYEAFDFFDLPLSVAVDEIERLVDKRKRVYS